MANNNKENKIKKFTKEAIGKTLNQFNKEIGIADLVEINKNQDRILNGILSQVNDESTEKTEKSNIITLDNSTDGIVELKEIQGDTNVNVSKIEEMPITHDIGDKEGNVFTLNEIPKGAISIGEIQGNTMVNCNKDDKKELVLMKDLSTQGDNNITLTEGVDGGKVDVALEGNTLVNVSKTKEETPITHEREEDTTGNHVALVDDGYIRPVLNGKTMVNVCDQKDTTAVTKSYTVENSGNHIALQGDIDGSCRPVITGNTLVNLLGTILTGKSDNNYAVFNNDGSITNKCYKNSYNHIGLYGGENLKTSTTYTVITNVIENNITLADESSNIDVILPMINNGVTITHSSKGSTYKVGETGTKYFTFITPDDISSWVKGIKFMGTPYNAVNDGSSFKIKAIILEGDYTNKPIPGYFEGLQSSFEDNLVTQEIVDSGEEIIDNLDKYKIDYKVTGKNKCRIDTFSMPSDTYYITLQTQFKEWCPNLITGKKYKMLYDYSYSEADTEGMVGFAVITSDLINLSTFVYTEEIGSKYIYVYGGHKQGVFSNIRCIEYDSADDSYEPYKGHTKTLYLNSPLLEGDTIEEKDGSVYHVHRSKQIVFDGSDDERWVQSPSNDSTKPNYFIWADGMFYKYTDTNQLCDKMKISNPYDDYSQNIVKIINGSARIRKDDYLEVGISSWLQSNPITLVAQLLEPVYELIEQSNLAISSYANGHLDLTSAVPIEKIEFKNTILENKYLYTNTEYTIQFEADKEGKAVISLGGTTLAETSIVKGINKITITTPETLTDNNLVLEGIGFNISNIVVTPAIEQDFGYFSGLSSTFESELVPENILGEKVTNTVNKVEYSLTKNIKPNTTYTIYLEGEQVVYCGFQKNSNWVKYITPSQCINTITTDDNVDINKFSIHASGNIRVDKCFLLEGDYTNYDFLDYDPTKIGKYKVDYKVTGKNKFDINTMKSKWWIQSDGIIKGNLKDFYSILVPIKNNCSYTLSCNVNLDRCWYALLDSDYNGIFILDKKTNKTIINNIGAKYLLWYLDSSGITDDYNIQVEEGDTTTSYEHYKEYTKTLYLNSPLLEGDTIEEKNDGIYHVHRYTKVVLDGVNNSGMSKERNAEFNDDNTMLKVSYTREDIKSMETTTEYDGSLCDKLYWKADIPTKASDTPCYGRSKQNWKLMINIPLTNNTEEAINTYLQSNPLTFVLPLETPQYELIEQSNLVIPSYANGHLDLASAVPVSKVNFLHFEEELTYLYPSTSYTVQFMSNDTITADISLGGTQLLAQNIVKGLNRISITTPETLLDNKLIIDGAGAKISEVVVTDTDKEFGYFEGMKSVGECEDLEVVSRNVNMLDINKLTDKNNWLRGTYWSYPIKVKPNTNYTLSMTGNKNERVWLGVFGKPLDWLDFIKYVLWDGYIEKDKDYIRNFNTGNKNIIYISMYDTTPIGAFGEDGKFKNVYLSETSLYNGYTPHQSNAQQLAHEPLRSVENVRDRYTLIDGKWYIERRCGEIVLDGSQNWDDYLGNNLMQCHLPNSRSTYNIKCDNIIPKSYQELDNVNNYGIAVIVDAVRARIPNITTSSEIDEYFTNNPTRIVYLLATPQYEPIDYNPFEVYSDITHISTNSAVPTNITIKNHGYNCLLKPSTTYTVSSNLGLNTVTTGADTGDSCLRFYDTDTSNITTMKNVLLLEGDWTSKADLIPANFSGIESCFEQELVTDENDVNYGKYKVTAKVVGKNLFKGYDDISEIKGGKVYILNSGTISTPTRFKFRVYDGNMKQITELSSRTYGVYYNESRKYFITGSDSSKLNNNKLDMPNNAKYLQPIENDQRYIDIQLEQGTEATAYEPYKESVIEFYIDEPLRGIGNIKDKVYVKNDKVIVERNCGSVVLDGSDDENWFISQSNKNTLFIGYQFSGNLIVSSNYSPICNKFKHKYSIDDEEHFYIEFNNRIFICINKNKLSTLNMSGFKQWIQDNPITIVYQLAEPTYEEVEYSSNRLILDTFNNESFNNSTLFLDTNISPKLSFKPLYEELVYVKNSTKYYIQFNAVGSGEVVINLGGTELTTEIVEGYNCIPITTPNESTNLMTIIGQGITISEVVVSEVVCGGYYKGLQSCFEEHMENGKYRVLLRGIALDGSKVNGIKLYINEPLRGIGNIKDRLCIKNGKLMVERNYYEVILDGSEPWDSNGSNANNELSGYQLITSNIPDCKIDNANLNSTFNINNLLPTLFYNMTYSGSYYGLTVSSYNNHPLIRVGVPTKYFSSINNWKNYLQLNNFVIVYHLKTPTYEEVTNEYGLPIVFEGYENGIVYIDSAVTPTTHIKYTSNNQLATTLSEAEEQNIATQEDINMNVITYMMDIDMMLTDMEMSNDISVMAVRRDSSNENMLDRMSEEDKKVYRDNTVVMLEKMITANVLDKEDIEGRIDMYYNKNRISKEQYKYLKSLL